MTNTTGNTQSKRSKISILIHMFELFKMKKNEIIMEMIIRFTDITNSFVSLGKQYTQVVKVRKVLRTLMFNWEKKTIAIEEATDLSTMTLENLIRNLMSYEVQIEDRKKDEQQHKLKKTLRLPYIFRHGGFR